MQKKKKKKTDGFEKMRKGTSEKLETSLFAQLSVNPMRDQAACQKSE